MRDINGMCTYAVYSAMMDGGAHWLTTEKTIFFITVLAGKPVAFGSEYYTEDRGATWQPLSISANAFAKDEATGLIFAAKVGGGVYTGRPGQWESVGLSNQRVRCLAISGRQLLAVSMEGKIFRTDISEIPTGLLFQ